MRIGWNGQAKCLGIRAISPIGWFVAIGVVCSTTWVWSQTGTRLTLENEYSGQKATGTVLLDRHGTKYSDPAGGKRIVSSSQGHNHQSQADEPEVKLEPPKLRPLNRIDVRTASSSNLAAKLPVAVQQSDQKTGYGPGSPYGMAGRLNGAEGKNGKPEDVGKNQDKSVQWEATGDTAKGDTAVGQVAVGTKALKPQVNRRPLPSRPQGSSQFDGVMANQGSGDNGSNEIKSGDRARTALPMNEPGISDKLLLDFSASNVPDLPASNSPDLPASDLDPPSLSSAGSSSHTNVEPSPITAFGKSPETAKSPSTPKSSQPDEDRFHTGNIGQSSPAPALNDHVSGQFQRIDGKSQVGLGLNKLPNPKPNSTLRDSNRLQTRSPRVQVEMEGPGQVVLGAPQYYTVLVQNTDVQVLEGLVLRVEIPRGITVNPKSPTHGQCHVESLGDGATLVNWNFERLAQSGNAALPLELIATTANDFAVAVEWTFQPFSAVAALQVLSPRLELSLEGPKEVNYGQPSTYRLIIENTGNADATNIAIQLSAQQYGSSSTVIERIPAGGQESMEVELTFKQVGSIQVAAEAKAAGGNLNSKSEVQVLVRQAQLDLFWDSPEVAYYGSAIPYVLHLKNSGDAPASGVRTEIRLPAEAKVLALPENAKMENGNLIWSVSELSPGALKKLTLQLAFQQEGENQVTASCSHAWGASTHSSAITLVQAVTDLKLVVTDPTAPARVGGEVVYEMTLENRGSRAAESVSVIALFSKDIEPVRAEGLASKIFPGQVRFDPIPKLGPGQVVQLKVYAIAEQPGMHRFRAEVNTGDAEVKLVQEETTQYIESVRRTARTEDASVIR